MRLEASFGAVQSSNIFAKKENSLGTTTTLPKTNIAPENGWSEKLAFPFSDGFLVGAMLVFGEGFSYSRWFMASSSFLQKTYMRVPKVGGTCDQLESPKKKRPDTDSIESSWLFKVPGSENDSWFFRHFIPTITG